MWKPAPNQQALNPIIYLKMDDPTQAGKNLGTGGDFTLNGVVARSGRGPSQFNAVYSDLNGSSQYLSRTTAPTGIADGGIFTFHGVVSADVATAGLDIISFYQSTSNERFRVYFSEIGGFARLNIAGRNSAGTAVLLASETTFSRVIGRNYVIDISIDLSDTGKRHVYVNGESVTMTWGAYTSGDINFAITTTPLYYIGRRGAGTYFDGRLGNVFFDTRYIDLSVPANLAKFVQGTGIDAKPANLGANGEKPFGTPPLIYLPMYGNNAGKNYGTGGDFTVNSGPFTGARGPNEFWGNKADFDGSTGYLYRTSALAGVSDGKTFSCSFYINSNNGLAARVFGIYPTAGSVATIRFQPTNTGTMTIFATNAAGSTILNAETTASPITSGAPVFVQISIDLTNTSKRFVYFNGVSTAVTWTTYINDNIDFTADDVFIGRSNLGATSLNGKLSEFYFTTDYIDFSQEANRLKFRDAFGNPVNLRPQIAAGTLPNPAIYMRFDPSNFGKNSGTGGDFVVNGTITDGGQL